MEKINKGKKINAEKKSQIIIKTKSSKKKIPQLGLKAFHGPVKFLA